MLEYAGLDLTDYFPPPLTVGCAGLISDTTISLTRANFTPLAAYAVHTSGALQTDNDTKLDNSTWYFDTLQPKLAEYYKGYYVFDKKDIAAEAEDQTDKYWGIYNKQVYDLSDYIYTQNYYAASDSNYTFLNSDISDLFEENTGQDVTKKLNDILAGLSSDDAANQMNCLNNVFYYGMIDFREDARCTVQDYLLLAFSIIMVSAIVVKFLAALQIGAKRHPELLDRFVICQVPCYTEGEESLKKTIDSLAVLNYDDKRKLIFVICDGNIIGSGNNRPTPRIVLDILGVDDKVDAEPLLFKSIGEGSKQLNYGKVFSGLYEHEGHVVPYLVVVKVGKPSETSKPGNRGKRDSQVLLLQYLNRVHFDAPMCPLELEIYHQMRNVIGIDPTFYEYIFQVDADTTVEPDSLNRLIACTADDQRIIGICGETKLANERESITTMIQVYEYYISHHLTKAFESLFGSVTCLPGCFSVYRIRTADKGRPVIISSIVIDEYSEPNVDTLHKKNLFSLGEDRYLTTLMMKHFPTYKMKFSADAIAHTVAPSSWKVLLSQRRRWINSTIHNLVELLFLPEMCGFCFFSMRFFVFIDLLGTIILPATFAYIIYLIVVVSTGKAAIPYISIGMIAAVYGLQAIIFILHREFMLIGWMVVYILAMPVYSVLLPIYSFWSMDDFSWGNTRQVVGEGNNKTVIYQDEETFDDSMIPYRTFKEYEANAWETASLQSSAEKPFSGQNKPYSHPRPHSRAPSSYSNSSLLPPGADYYRDSSPLGASHSSPALRHTSSRQSLASAPGMNPYAPRVPSMAGLSAWGGASMYDSPLQPPPHNPFDSPLSSQLNLHPHSMYPPPPMGGLGAPRNSMMSLAGPVYGLPPPPPPPPMGPGASGMSSFSLVSGSPYAPPAQGPSPLGPQQTGTTALVPDENPAPNDEDVLRVLRAYLKSQDLMAVTKRSAREAIYGLFPAANLQARAGWLNEHIDRILSE
ncbi:Chitin synthase 4 [Cryptotrichosporon argae]